MGKHGGEHSFPIGVHQQKTKDCPDSERESERESGRFVATCPVEQRVGSSVAGWPVVEKKSFVILCFQRCRVEDAFRFLILFIEQCSKPSTVTDLM